MSPRSRLQCGISQHVSRALVTLLLLALIIGPAPAGAADPLLIGEINPRTGVLAFQGLAVAQGVQIAIEGANARGGVAGRPVRLLERDDEGKPERAIAAAEELTARHRVAALVGGYVDSLVGPVSEVAERSRTPYIATASLDERLTQRGYRYFFRVSSLRPYVEATVGLVRDVIRPARVAILYSSTPGASQLAVRQREALTVAAIQIPVFEPFSPGLSDFTPLLGRVRDRDAEVLLSDAFFADHLLIVRQLAQSGIRVRSFLGAFGLEFPAVIRELGPAAEGLLGTTAWQPGVFVPAAEAESRAFVQAYRARFGQEPAPLSMHGYAAVQALLAAMSAVARGGQAPAGDPLREALARVDLETPLGRVKFDSHGDPLFYERVIVQIQGGRHVVVYPPGVATARLVYPRP
ncbi:MAG: ABC transporter substrate-binding protein [Candidatus Rokubacteria bacterium]|nr:ABC transporter substrate-binding protein [Candidatus Rokubacteria bacterium]